MGGNVYEFHFWGDKNFLKLDYYDGYTTLNILYTIEFCTLNF